MPFYEYRCEACGHELEALQKLSDDPLIGLSRLRQAHPQEADLRRRLPPQGRRLVRDGLQGRQEEESARCRWGEEVRDSRGFGKARWRGEEVRDSQESRQTEHGRWVLIWPGGRTVAGSGGRPPALSELAPDWLDQYRFRLFCSRFSSGCGPRLPRQCGSGARSSLDTGFDRMRSHYCGVLNEGHIGQEVTLCGWVQKRRDHGGVIFIDLRDREGLVQVVFDPDTPEVFRLAESARSEYVLMVSGRVRPRPAGTENRERPTGMIEVLGQGVTVLNSSETPPFQLDEHHQDASEELRLRYRYLDLRRPEMQERLRLRSRVTQTLRRFLDDHGFLDIETPILTKSTPEGARDYLVPSRTHPGQLLRTAPVAAALQAVADDVGHGPLLPGGPLLPRRGPARRPAAGVHPARHRGLLHGRGRPHGAHGGR